MSTLEEVALAPLRGPTADVAPTPPPRPRRLPLLRRSVATPIARVGAARDLSELGAQARCSGRSDGVAAQRLAAGRGARHAHRRRGGGRLRHPPQCACGRRSTDCAARAARRGRPCRALAWKRVANFSRAASRCTHPSPALHGSRPSLQEAAPREWPPPCTCRGARQRSRRRGRFSGETRSNRRRPSRNHRRRPPRGARRRLPCTCGAAPSPDVATKKKSSVPAAFDASAIGVEPPPSPPPSRAASQRRRARTRRRVVDAVGRRADR